MRYNERAKRVLRAAKQAARVRGHGVCGTEHILLGIVNDPDCIAAGVLEGLGATAEALTAKVNYIVGGPIAKTTR